MAGARIGAGCNVGDHAFVEDGVVVGDNVTIKNNVLLWNGVTVEDDVFLGPNAVFTNDLRPRSSIKRPVEQYLVPTHVRRGATIGANATIVCGVTIGRYAFVAAGGVVVGDVPDYALVAGNPARRLGWVCCCAESLDEDLRCDACGRTYSQTDDGLAPVPDANGLGSNE